MKKFTKILILSVFTIFMIGGFANSVFASAVPNTVQFENQPLFGEENFVPGDTVSKWIKITNNTETNHKAVIRSLNENNVDNLGDVVRLVIRQGSIILFDDTFTNFFKGDVTLPEVVSGQTNTINLEVSFLPGSGNDYQSKTMGFNLQVGLDDGESSTDETIVIGGGGGVRIGIKNLIISNENAVYEEQAVENITVTWDTNMPATSQVIYGPAGNGPYTLNLSAPNFGYPSATAEIDLGKVTSHVVVIPNLPVGEYIYRVVSRASPPTISYEHRFIVPAKPAKAEVQNDDGNGVVTLAEEETADEGILSNAVNNLLTAAAGNILGIPTMWFWIALLLLILLIIFIIIFRRRKDKKEKPIINPVQ